MRPRLVVPLFLLPLLLTGCAFTDSAAPGTEPQTGSEIKGIVHGGQQMIVGSHVYLYAAGTGGYGGNGIAPSTSNASTSLLNSNVETNNPSNYGFDGTNYYVTTNSIGAFSISSDYTCSTGQQLYLYAVGGNPGAGANSAAGMLAAIGDCSTISSGTYVTINEVSTVATAYALAGFATDATHISSSGTTLASTGIKNAFANVTNLETLSTGVALATTPVAQGANGIVPQTKLNSLANILAACVNTNGPTMGNCPTLLNTATSNGTNTGTVPTDTATAAIYIAQNPGANMTTLYGLTTPNQVFGPALTVQPNDFTVSISFTGGGLNDPDQIIIDASGNAWITNTSNNSLSEFSALGTPFSGSPYTGGGLNSPEYLAIDTSGNVWVGNNGNSSFSKFNSSGGPVSGASGYTGGGMQYATGVAIDATGNVWIASYGGGLSKFNSSGTPLHSSAYLGGGLSLVYAIAIDASGNVWAGNTGNYSVSKFNSSGIASSAAGYPASAVPDALALDSSGNVWTGSWAGNTSVYPISELNSSGGFISTYTGSGLKGSKGLAVDGANNIWVSNWSNSNLSEFNSAGTAISASGYNGICDLCESVAIDGSGDVWAVNNSNNTTVEVIGAGTPVVTPIVANLVSPYSAPASKP